MGFLMASLIFLPWLLTFSIGKSAPGHGSGTHTQEGSQDAKPSYEAGGPAAVGQSFYEAWNMGGITFQIPL